MDTETRRIIKEGIVTAVFPERYTARVTFDDKDGMVSAELPIITPFALNNKMYSLVDVGEEVLCIFATNDDTSGEGWIIGSRYHENAPPKVADQNIFRLDFSDGSFIEYDRSKNQLRIEIEGDIRINGRRIFLNE